MKMSRSQVQDSIKGLVRGLSHNALVTHRQEINSMTQPPFTNDNALIERYFSLSPQEQQIVRNAIFDKNRMRGLSLCQLYFPGADPARLMGFMNSMQKQKL